MLVDCPSLSLEVRQSQWRTQSVPNYPPCIRLAASGNSPGPASVDREMERRETPWLQVWGDHFCREPSLFLHPVEGDEKPDEEAAFCEW